MGENSSRHLKCTSCGASLEYAPGVSQLKCPFCGAANEITISEQEVEELSLDEWLEKSADEAETEEHASITCTECGAISNVDNIKLSHCPFCALPLRGEAKPLRLVKPKSLLPFEINQEEALVKFHKWLDWVWILAPNKFRRKMKHETSMKGIYIPYWTFDISVVATYTGKKTTGRRDKKGDKGYRWTDVSGSVADTFDDLLVPATNSLPPELQKPITRFWGWGRELIPYQEDFLAGFQSEAYSIDLKNGYMTVREYIDDHLRAKITEKMEGLHQQITSVDLAFSTLTFKHILLPVWISSYRFNGKTFHYLIDGYTGEVQGEWPKSRWKIAALIAFWVFGIGVAVFDKLQ